MPARRYGHYDVLNELGHGGMGTVYRALDANLRREVALKVLSGETAKDEVLVQRFIREARALARLRHPNLVQVYTVGEQDSHYYYAMELIEGKSLADVLHERKRLSVGETVDICTQILGALREVHKAGVVHRDVKPGNIMLDTNNRVVLMDFGLAKSSQDKSLTSEEIILGTPDYMSPEQALGQKLSPASDLYSVGVMMFQMLSGQLPFRGKSSIQIVQKHIREPAPSLAASAPGVPESLAAIVNRLLAKSPDDRFPTAEALMAALAKALPAQAARTAPTLPAVSVRQPPGSAGGQASQPVTPRAAPRSPDFSHAETADMDETTDQTGESSLPTLAPAPAERPPASQPALRLSFYVLVGAVCIVLMLLVAVRLGRRTGEQPPAPSTASTASTTSTTVPPDTAPAPKHMVEIFFRDGRKVQGDLVRIDSDGVLTLDLGDGKEPVRHRLSEIKDLVRQEPAGRPGTP